MHKLKFNRKKTMVSQLLLAEIYIDGNLVKKLRNGEIYEHYVEEGEHEIAVIVQSVGNCSNITKNINVQNNMEFNIEVNINSFDLEVLNQNNEKDLAKKDFLNDSSNPSNSKTRSSPFSSISPGTITLCFGLFVILLGIIWGFNTPLENYGETTADIIEVKEHGWGRSSYGYTLILQYKVNGQVYQAKIGESSKEKKAFKVGQHYNLVYDINNPSKINHGDVSVEMVGPFVFGGAVCLLAVFLKKLEK